MIKRLKRTINYLKRTNIRIQNPLQFELNENDKSKDQAVLNKKEYFHKKTADHIKPESPENVRFVVSTHKDGWSVKSNTNSPVQYAYNKKQEAVNTGIYLAKVNEADLVITESDGTVQKVISYVE